MVYAYNLLINKIQYSVFPSFIHSFVLSLFLSFSVYFMSCHDLYLAMYIMALRVLHIQFSKYRMPRI